MEKSKNKWLFLLEVRTNIYLRVTKMEEIVKHEEECRDRKSLTMAFHLYTHDNICMVFVLYFFLDVFIPK